jgi:type VI secretion system protein ImpG
VRDGANLPKTLISPAGSLEPDKYEDPMPAVDRDLRLYAAGPSKSMTVPATESWHILYPHYISPIPSMSVVKFEPVKKSIPASGYRIERDAVLHSKPVAGNPCQFKSCYPVTLWPVEVTSVTLRDPRKPLKSAQQVIEIQMKAYNNLTFSQLPWEGLRFFLNGPGQHVFHLYELLLNHVCQVDVYPSQQGRLEGICRPGRPPDDHR